MSGSFESIAKEPVQSEKDKLELAAKNCRSMLEINPKDTHCLHVLALIEVQLGHCLHAIQSIEKSLEIDPNNVNVLCNYGVMLAEQKRYEEAAEALGKAIKLEPNNIEAHYHYGNILFEQSKLNEAMKCYLLVLSIQPNHIYALNNLGNVYKIFENYEEAILCYQRILALQPSFPLALNNLGLTLTAVGNFEQAMDCFQKALSLQPNYTEVLNNIGVILRLEGKFEASCLWYRQALTLRPDYEEAWNNLGNALKDKGDLDGAIEAYECALRLSNTAEKRHNLAMAHLTKGNFDLGWHLYEARWQTKQLAFTLRNFSQPMWQGDDGHGRVLMIHAEQGLGDSLQFCRYVSLAADLGFRIVLEVQPALSKLMHSLRGVESVVPRGEMLPDFDVHCPMLSMPFLFQTRLETIPATVPYLSPDERARDKWRQHFVDASEELKVGIVWSGNPRLHSLDSAAIDRRRSIPFELLEVLFNIPHVKFFSLQKGASRVDAHPQLIDYMDQCDDFLDTAALIENLDLVISVDTSVAHLAGAMGKPVWLLNRFDTCWRWMRDREDSLWYPTLRQFRQQQPGDWVSVMTSVRDALSNPDNVKELIKRKT